MTRFALRFKVNVNTWLILKKLPESQLADTEKSLLLANQELSITSCSLDTDGYLQITLLEAINTEMIWFVKASNAIEFYIASIAEKPDDGHKPDKEQVCDETQGCE